MRCQGGTRGLVWMKDHIYVIKRPTQIPCKLSTPDGKLVWDLKRTSVFTLLPHAKVESACHVFCNYVMCTRHGGDTHCVCYGWHSCLSFVCIRCWQQSLHFVCVCVCVCVCLQSETCAREVLISHFHVIHEKGLVTPSPWVCPWSGPESGMSPVQETSTALPCRRCAASCPATHAMHVRPY